jgi:hypothetical protein
VVAGVEVEVVEAAEVVELVEVVEAVEAGVEAAVPPP